MASYNLQQQVFTLSMLANADAGMDIPSPPMMANELNGILTSKLSNPSLIAKIGNWSVDWGPVVYQKTTSPHFTFSGVADQTMVVFKSNNPDSANRGPVYVVAVAGTNFLSTFDIDKEDGALYPRQTLPGFTPPVYISNGTSTGLSILTSIMKNTQITSSSTYGTDIATYLKSVQKTGSTLIFTGHSLGGALAPTLALSLYPTKSSMSGWKSAYVYPTAAPNPGGTEFQENYQELFPPTNDPITNTMVWNQLVWNTKDLVPHAWDYSDGKNSAFPVMDQIPGLYTEIASLTYHTETYLCMAAVVKAAKLKAQASVDPIKFQPITTNPGVQGTFYNPAKPPSPYPAPNPAPPAMGPLTYWFTEAMFQHIFAYFYLLNVSDLITEGILPTENPFNAGSPLQQAAAALAQKLCKVACPTLPDCSQGC